MIHELYRIETTETALNVTTGKIDSIRRKQIVKSGCRVYEGGCIGIAGTLGEATAETWKQAEENLQRRVPYYHAPVQNHVRAEDRTDELLTPQELTARAEHLLERLHAAFPHMILSNKIHMNQIHVSLTNDSGLELHHRETCYVVSLLAKDQDSAAVFDTFIPYIGRCFDADLIFADASQVLQAHRTPITLPEGKLLPVILAPNLFAEPLDQALNGQLFHRGASLLSGKQGQQIFSPDLTFCADRSPENYDVPFFDTEGSTLPEDSLPLIEKGVLLRACADKKTAAEFHCENTAAAGGSYDDLPQLTAPFTSFMPTGKSLQAMLQGRDAALVVTASGGDCTPDGMLATPVQTAYLYRDGRLLGRLPEFSVRGSLFDLLGRQYLGCSDDTPFGGSHWIAVEAEVTV